MSMYLYSSAITSFGGDMAQSEFAAFISYSRVNESIARSLQSYLERYRIPSDLNVDLPFEAGKRMPRCFRDRDELPASTNLGAALEASLDRASALIVIASPDAAASKWVNAEIEFFKSRGRASPVLLIVADGEPHAESRGLDPAKEAFPPAVREIEPAWVSLKSEGRKLAFAKILAGLLNVDVDVIIQRQRQRFWRMASSALSATAVAGLVVFAGFQYQAQQAAQKILITEAREAITVTGQLAERADTHGAISTLLSWIDRLDRESPGTLEEDRSLRSLFEAQIDKLLALTPPKTIVAKVDHEVLGVGSFASHHNHFRSPDGRYLIFDGIELEPDEEGHRRRGVAILDADQGQLVYRTPLSGPRAQNVAISNDGANLLNCFGYAYSTMTCQIIKLAKDKAVRGFTYPHDRIVTLGTQRIGPGETFALFPFFENGMLRIHAQPIGEGEGEIIEFPVDHGRGFNTANIRYSPDGSQFAVMAPKAFYLARRKADRFEPVLIKGADNAQPLGSSPNSASFAVDFDSQRVAYSSVTTPVTIRTWDTKVGPDQAPAHHFITHTTLADCNEACVVIGFLERGRILVVKDLRQDAVIAYQLPEYLDPDLAGHGVSLLAKFKARVDGIDQAGLFLREYNNGISSRYHLGSVTAGLGRPIRGYKSTNLIGWVAPGKLLVLGYNGSLGLGPPPDVVLFDTDRFKILARSTVRNVSLVPATYRAGNDVGVLIGGDGPLGPFLRYDQKSGSLVPVPVEVPAKTTYAKAALFYEDNEHACVLWRDPFDRQRQMTILSLKTGQQVRAVDPGEQSGGLMRACEQAEIIRDGQSVRVRALLTNVDYPYVKLKENRLLLKQEKSKPTFRKKIDLARQLIPTDG